MPTHRIAGLYGNSTFNLSRSSQTVFHSSCTISLFPPAMFSTSLPTLAIFMMIAILVGVSSSSEHGSDLHFPDANKVGHFFFFHELSGHLSIFFGEIFKFRFFAHFWTGLFVLFLLSCMGSYSILSPNPLSNVWRSGISPILWVVFLLSWWCLLAHKKFSFWGSPIYRFFLILSFVLLVSYVKRLYLNPRSWVFTLI